MKIIRIFFSLILLVGICFIPEAPSFAANITHEKVIVQFKGSINKDLIHQVQGNIQFQYPTIHAVAMEIPTDQFVVLKNDPSVLAIQENHPVQMENQIENYGVTNTHADEAQTSGFTGKGVKIAILDTGVDMTHPDLKIAGGECYLDSCPNSYTDDNGHGTHVAGIISAQNNDIGVLGVAPDASIYAIKVLDSEGNGSTATVIAGIDWAIQNHMDIINMSLSTPDSDPLLEAAVDKAYNAGILVVAAAGNGGTLTGTSDTVEYPAKYSSVIAVASLNQNNQRLDSSATGAEVEVAAPGEDIYSTVPTAFDDGYGDGQINGYTYMTGTSMATPFVSGILAQYKQQYPDKTNVELRSMLQSHALDLGNPGRDSWYGYGLVQANSMANVPKMDVTTNPKNGVVDFTLASLPTGSQSFNVYRNGKKIIENQSKLTFHDYVLKGTYTYQFSTNTTDGKISDLTSPIEVNVTSPYFTDLTNENWYAPELIYLYNQSILSGYSDGAMKPDQLVTRAQAVAMVGRAIGLDGTKRKTVFNDVNSSSFASGYIQSAFENKILKGFPDGSFHPDQPVTRAEMAILLANAYHLTATGTQAFQDVTNQVTGYEEINEVAEAKITVGFPDGTFKPYKYMKRSDFGVFVARAKDEEFR